MDIHHFSVLLCLLWEFMNVAQVGEPIEGGGEFKTCQHKRILIFCGLEQLPSGNLNIVIQQVAPVCVNSSVHT